MDVLGYILALSPFLNFDLVEKKIPKLIQSEAKILETFLFQSLVASFNTPSLPLP